MRRGVALAILVLSAGAAQAGVTRYQLKVECKFDMEQYCKSIKKELKREMRECLASHEKDLLPRCQDHYKEAR